MCERRIVSRCKYECLPVWDQSLPRSFGRYSKAIKRFAQHDGDVYFHCIMGRERSSVAAAFFLLERGWAKTIDEAYTQLRKARPTVEWRELQKEYARKHAPTFIAK